MPKLFSSSFSVEKRWEAAAEALAAKAQADLGSSPCSLALLFVSEAYPRLKSAELSARLASALKTEAFLGCNASGVIGPEREVEMEPAMSLLAMHLPGVKVETFELSGAELGRLEGAPELVRRLDVYPSDRPNFLCLADPMTCDADKLLALFNAGYPGRPVIGGLASGAAVGAAGWLALDGEVRTEGAVGACLSGDVEVRAVVAQGCRPIGAPFTITKADRHILYALAGRPAFEVLRETVEALPEEDQLLARRSLFAGLVMDESHTKMAKGDFLIRNLMGIDPASGAVMVGANLKPGQTLQFHLRDAKTSAEDLRELLKTLPEGRGAQGAFLASCCGRGRGLYGVPDHDLKLVKGALGDIPIGGFFANGELGPVGGKNYIHGYTSSLAVIR